VGREMFPPIVPALKPRHDPSATRPTLVREWREKPAASVGMTPAEPALDLEAVS